MVHSTKKLKIPAIIGQIKCNIETEVVPAKIPLLLSKESMKRAGTVLNMENDHVVMFSQPVKPDFTSSGHYCVNTMDKEGENIHGDDHDLVAAEDVTLKEQRNEDVERQHDKEILTISEKMNIAGRQKILTKLHRQFGHTSADRLQRLLASSRNKDAECNIILQRIVS